MSGQSKDRQHPSERLLCEEAKPGEILASDRALLKLDPGAFSGRHRRFRAKGAPKDLAVYSLAPVSG